MTSESTSLDPNQDSQEPVADATLPEPVAEVEGHNSTEQLVADEPAPIPDEPQQVTPPTPGYEEPIILLDPDYQAPVMNPADSELPPIASGSILHGNRPLKEGVQVEISQQALEQIRLHSESDIRTELGGFLLGTTRQHGGQTTVEVRAALPAHSDDHGPIHFTFTADSWALMHQEREAIYPHLQVVGWFHTHPDLGVFYSGDDVVVHTVGFSLPWHVGLVVDPVRLNVGWFGWFGEGHNKELDKIVGYYEMTDIQPKAITPWSYAERSAVWASYSESELVYGSNSTYGDQYSAAPSSLDGIGAFLGLVGVFIALMVWLLGYVPLRRQVTEMEQAAVVAAEVQYASDTAQGLIDCENPDLRFVSPQPGQWVAAGSTITVEANAFVRDATAYRLIQTNQTGFVNHSRDIAYYEFPTISGEVTQFQVPLLDHGTAIELELIPVSETPNTDFCTMTFYVGNP